ncbi:hypothetical protein ACHAWC_000784 [Mediolabrus comicus]
MRHRWLFITVTCVLPIHACYAASIISRLQSQSSYQPTPGVEERWVAEEEFYKASDIATAEPNVDSDSWWDDDEEESDVEVGQSNDDHLHDDYSTTPSTKDRSHEKQRRWRRRKRSEDKGNVEESSPTSKQSTGDTTNNNDDIIHSSQYDDEHELRTDEWELDIRLSRLFAQEAQELFPESCADGRERDGKSSSTYRKLSSNDRYRKRQVMTFARNGYVKVSDMNNQDDRIDNNTTPPRNNNRPRVGKWRIGHSGVAFDIPVLISANRKSSGSNSDKVMSPKEMTVLHYHADIHLNKFGERPRMFRGVITRDRHSSFLPPNLFRPVIGTFSAEGIGHDTVDTSYKARAISLSRQQVINDAKTNSNKK